MKKEIKVCDSITLIKKQISITYEIKQQRLTAYIKAKGLYIEHLEQLYNRFIKSYISEKDFYDQLEFINKVLYRRYLHKYMEYLKICNELDTLHVKLDFYRFN